MHVDYEVYLRKPNADDITSLKEAFDRSKDLHLPWSYPPENYIHYIQSSHLYLTCLKEGNHIVGVFNISGVMRGFFQSAYLGYQVFSPYNNKGYMKQGIRLVIHEAFSNLKLHRLEANIQPENYASKALIQKAGFKQEGFSPQYLQIGGKEWKDHERWAIINNNWQAE